MASFFKSARVKQVVTGGNRRTDQSGTDPEDHIKSVTFDNADVLKAIRAFLK